MGRTTTLDMGRVNVPVDVVNSTTLYSPSEPMGVLVTSLNNYSFEGRLSCLIRTMSRLPQEVSCFKFCIVY